VAHNKEIIEKEVAKVEKVGQNSRFEAPKVGGRRLTAEMIARTEEVRLSRLS
jgi:hypothetical protein